MSVERIIGIDFGTSTSVIRIKRYRDGQPVEDRLSKQDVIFNGSNPMVPTLIQRTDKGTYYGHDALISKRGETLFQNFKVNLESADPAQRQEARTLTEEFFAYMAKEYRAQSEGGHFGDPSETERTIVSYPVKWSDETKAFMIKAAEKAGFVNVEGMDEAQAAIYAVTVQNEDYLTKHGLYTVGLPCNILLVDMGAGTTDLVLCRHTPGEYPKNEIISTWPRIGDTLFGGREVDEILREYIRSLLPKENADNVLKKNNIKEFKVWKETVVSPTLERKEMVEEFSSIDNIVDLLNIEMEPYDLDRSVFEMLAGEYLEKFPRLIADCIDNSGISKEEIDLVVLTGGHSQWYFVNEMLSDSAKVDLPKICQNPGRIIRISRPQETVALGMIYRPLLAEFQKNDKNDIIAYYRNNINSLITFVSGTAVAVKADGTLVCEDSLDDSMRSVITCWSHIVSILCNYDYSTNTHLIAGLRKNGLVVFTGDSKKNGWDVQNWRNIVSISRLKVFENVIIGLKKDGTVAVAGAPRFGWNVQDVWDWKDIISVSDGMGYIVGLKKDGTVVATGNNNYGQCNVRDWRNIVSVLCSTCTIGLRKDGTVVATGDNSDGQCNVQGWKDIIAIAHSLHTVGLKKDGTVVATGDNRYGQCDVQGWENIIDIRCGACHTIGLKKDGTLVATGRNDAGQCDIVNWQNILAIGAIGSRTFAIKSDGQIICNDYELHESWIESEKKTHREFTPKGSRVLPWKLF